MTMKTRPVRGKRVGLIKYFIWVHWLSLIVLLFAKAGGVKILDPTYMTERGVSVIGLPGYITYYGVVAVFLLPSLLGRRRLACRSICWMAPFMIIGRRIKDALPYPSLRLSARRHAARRMHSVRRVRGRLPFEGDRLRMAPEASSMKNPAAAEAGRGFSVPGCLGIRAAGSGRSGAAPFP
jgi:hypothetical protein